MPSLNATESLISPESRLAQAVDEFLARRAAGETPSIESFTTRYADLEAELPDVLGMLDALSGMDDDADSPDGAVARSRTLGDYRLNREIGRGGMGIVYEAEQLSLARRVALKILPFAAVLDPRHLQRFKNEALAAAHLDHPNIVEVYGVGCERGVHFYAMRYVEGQTLAEVIDLMRNYECGMRNEEGQAADVAAHSAPSTPHSVLADNSALCAPHSALEHHSPLPIRPSPLADTAAIHALSTLRTERPKDYHRRIAELGIQAAEALDHAHQMGIVHRDIKPSNLMVESASSGQWSVVSGQRLATGNGHRTTPKLYITDFGLARVESDASLTMTGDLLGTLRYMSPEQADGRSAILDHRTDIYSLGITLYELITLQPTFNGTDRQELLRQIAFDEPTPPRKLNPSIPHDLETLVLKAIEKNPADRYATAREFADDLEHFCRSEPIRARRATFPQKLIRWSRRHVAFVWSAAATSLLIATILALAIAYVLHERTQTTEALAKAQTSAQLAKEAIDDVFAEFADQRVPYGIAVTEREKTLLEKAARYYDRLITEVGDSDASIGAVTTLVHIAETHHAWGTGDRGKSEAQRAVGLAESLLAADPKSPDIQAVLAKALTTQRQVSSSGDVSVTKRITNLWESVSAARPNDVTARANLAGAWIGVAAWHHSRRDYTQADIWGDRAYAAMSQLLLDNPNNLELKKHGWVMLNYAHLQLDLDAQGSPIGVRPGRRDRSQRAKREGIECGRALVKELPNSAECQGRLGKALMNSEFIFDNAESAKNLSESIEIWQRLDTQFPEFPAFNNCLSFAYPQIQRCLLAEGQLAAYVEVLRDEIDFQNNSLGRTRDRVSRANLESSIAHRYQLIALLFNRLCQESDSRQAIETGLAFLERALTELNDRPDNSAPESELWERQVVLQCLAEMSWQLGRHAEAAGYAQQFASESRQHIARYPESANVRRRLAWFLASWPDDGLRNTDEAIHQAKEALKRSATAQEKDLAASALRVAKLRKGNWDACIAGVDESKATDCLVAALAHGKLGRGDEAKMYYERAVSLMNKEFDFVVTRRFGIEQLRAEVEKLLGISKEGDTGVASTDADN